jgi:hypothetical protein
MWPFTRRTKWASVLRDCDFDLAKREIADFFAMTNREADKKGGANYWKPELAKAWEDFADNPSAKTAAALLNVAPMFLCYFEACRPGGQFYEFAKLRKP